MKFILSIFVVLAFSKTAYASCEDVLREVKVDDVCTKISTYKSEHLTDKPILLIALHGDSPFNNPGYQYVFAKKVAEENNNIIAVGMLRPGYTDNEDRQSSGDRGDAVGDNYDEPRVTQVAGAITRLKALYQPQKIILAGHSGGSAITANLIALYPDLVDHAVIVSCPCNVEKWREDMYALTEEPIFTKRIETLSPVELVDSVPEKIKVSMFIGSRDPVTKKYLSEEYQSLLSERGVSVSLQEVEGEHNIFLNDEVINSVTTLIRNYNEALQ